MSIEGLFSPFRIKGLELKNRFVMAPLTRSFHLKAFPGMMWLVTIAAAPRMRWG